MYCNGSVLASLRIVFDMFSERCELIDWYQSVSFHSWQNSLNCTAYTITEANEALLPCSELTLKWNFINLQEKNEHATNRSKAILGLGISPPPSWPTYHVRQSVNVTARPHHRHLSASWGPWSAPHFSQVIMYNNIYKVRLAMWPHGPHSWPL